MKNRELVVIKLDIVIKIIEDGDFWIYFTVYYHQIFE